MFFFFDVRWCWIWSQRAPEARFCSSRWKLTGCVDGFWNLSRSDISHLPTLETIHALLFQRGEIYFKRMTQWGGGCERVSSSSSCATKTALKSAGFVFIPCLEVSAPWLWMANYHRANGSRLSLLLVTWLYSSDVFFSPSLSFITRDDNGGFSVGETFFQNSPPEVKHLLRGHKSFSNRRG